MKSLMEDSYERISRKGNGIIIIVIFCAVFSSLFSMQLVFGQTGTIDCAPFEIRQGCEYGGIYQMLLGDALAGVLLGFLFHHMAKKTNKKLEKIIRSQDELRKRRKDYAVLQMKSLFNTTLFTMGTINKQISNFNKAYFAEKNDDKRTWVRGIMLSEIRAEEAKMGRILASARNTLIASNDVLDPEITEQISGTITFIAEITRKEDEKGALDLPKYDVCKSKIKYLMEIFANYNFTKHTFAGKSKRETQQISKFKKELPKNKPFFSLKRKNVFTEGVSN